MSDTLPVLVPLSEDEERQANELFQARYYEDYTGIRDYFDDAVSGFWKTWKPAQRLALYSSHEPVFTDDTLQIEAWLQQAYAGNVDIGLLLAPYWRQMYSWRPLECQRMLRDYSSILVAQNRRREKGNVGLLTPPVRPIILAW